VGNGSDEILAFSFGAFFDSDKKILFPDISYSFYPVYARFFDLPYEKLPVDDSFRIIPESYFQINSGIVEILSNVVDEKKAIHSIFFTPLLQGYRPYRTLLEVLGV
jgi:hypothetical protein